MMTIIAQIKSFVPPANERKKLVVPLALIFFCILFNLTILRDTKDVLMVTTTPKSGTEMIPFIKTNVNHPAAIVSLDYLARNITKYGY
jgi:ATP:ADP antiporter, AAA family